MDGEAREVLLVLVRATFRLAPKGDLERADEQEPIHLADEYRGEPGMSSLRIATDVAPFKPAIDVLISGCAYPDPRQPEVTLAGFRFGELKKVVRVFGDRRWEKGVLGLRATPAARFEKIP